MRDKHCNAAQCLSLSLFLHIFAQPIGLRPLARKQLPGAASRQIRPTQGKTVPYLVPFVAGNRPATRDPSPFPLFCGGVPPP